MTCHCSTVKRSSVRSVVLAGTDLVIIFLAVLLYFANTPLLRAQSSASDWQIAAGGKMTFDVSSVKQNKSADQPATTNVPLGAGSGFTPTGGLFATTNSGLAALIAFAYKVTYNQPSLTLQSQLPKWAITERFDIQARAQGNPTKDQLRLMVQSLLADRFKLAIHTETRQLPVFGLFLEKSGKTGPQLQPHSDAAPCASTQPWARLGSTQPQGSEAGFPAVCGALVEVPAGKPGRLRMGERNVPMNLIASALPALGELGRPVVDETGLEGTFDFALEWTPEMPANVNFQPDPFGPTFLEALKDQLGLKLVPQTGPVDVFVIDHVEEPTDN
jgi:uncharacterized protein (TIGR03435 family)